METMSSKEIRLLSVLQKLAGDAGVVQHVGLFGDGDVWSAYFSTEFAALRVYHAYGGGDVFGSRRVKPVIGGKYKGSFCLTSCPDEAPR